MRRKRGKEREYGEEERGERESRMKGGEEEDRNGKGRGLVGERMREEDMEEVDGGNRIKKEEWRKGEREWGKGDKIDAERGIERGYMTGRRGNRIRGMGIEN